MLDLEKSYNVYEKVMDDKNYGIFDGKSVKQYFVRLSLDKVQIFKESTFCVPRLHVKISSSVNNR